MTRTIADLRVAIDALDKQLLHTLNQRAALANEVGDIKRKEGSQIFRPERRRKSSRKCSLPTAAHSKTPTLPTSGAKSCRPAVRWKRR